ncbi:MAG: BCCT family transporter [Lachnospiraceae bacterium]|nr:BCCT family transporter [Lachnospiraceae bacterium]
MDREQFKRMDWFSILVPLSVVILLCISFALQPQASTLVLESMRHFVGDTCSIYFAVLGVGVLLFTVVIGLSRYGRIRFGNLEKPEYSDFRWGALIFTSTMAADILFYSLTEWALYANEPYIEELGGIQKWASTYPLFHWGPIAWGFYIALAVAFGYMFHVRGTQKQKYSEACRPLLGKKVDGVAGKIIDLIAIFSLIAGTSTTFSVTSPLLSAAVAKVFHLEDSTKLAILILIVIAVTYTLVLWFGMKAISRLAVICVVLFLALLGYVLLFGGETRYVLETGFSALGNMVQNFIGMATWLDPLRENLFPQNWTVYYWAYWMVWCVATPFFIGTISKGRTIRNMVFGGYFWGLCGTFMTFIILGNYGLAQQMKHGLDVSGYIAAGGLYSESVIRVFVALPLPALGLLLLVITMILFYATTFDSLAMVISYYSYKKIATGVMPGKPIRIFWSIVFILFPIALISSESSIYSLQSVSIIAAFPIGVIIIMICVSLVKQLREDFPAKKEDLK